MRLLWVMLAVSLLGNVSCKKIHLGFQDLSQVSLRDVLQMALPALNNAKDTVKEAATFDNFKAGITIAGDLLGEGAQTTVKAYNDAGGVTGIAKNVAGKVVDAFEAVKDLVKPDSPLTTNPNFVAEKLEKANILPQPTEPKISLKELAQKLNSPNKE